MIKKILVNSTLLLVLFILIGAPMGTMIITKLNQKEPAIVLSSQDAREKHKIPDDTPPEIEEYIRKLEEEFYQTTQSTESTQELE